MTKKHNNSSKKKAKAKEQPADVGVSDLPLPAATNESSDKRDLYTENEGFFSGSDGYNLPDYRNGHLATPLPSRSSSLASEVSVNSLADLLGSDLDDDHDSIHDQDHDLDSQEGCKSTDQTPSVAESKEVHDDLSSWISSGHEKTQSVPGLQGRDWAAIGVLTFTAMAVRLWEIETPNQVVLDEAHVGKYVNGYLTKQFMFDTHPPLGKMLLAGISKIAGNYSGTFPFDDISDTYPSDLPYKTMRSVVAGMGALCAPMAYFTLRALGQAPSAAILAAFMIIFDNALIASHRLMTLEAPRLFFTALSLLSWAKFTEQESRPFTGLWWTWLAMTGVAVAGASATKTDGLLTLLTITVLAGWDLMRQAREEADQRLQWRKHVSSRILALLILPFSLYLALFSLHLTLQSHQPPYRKSAQGEYDLMLLSHPFQHSLLSPYIKDQNPTQAWSDVVYGSVIQLQSETRPAVFLHSFKQMWSHSAVTAAIHDPQLDQDQCQYQQVAGYEYSDLNTLWIVVRANMTCSASGPASVTTKGAASSTIEHPTTPNTKQDDSNKEEENEIPNRLRYLRDGDLIRLRHVSTRRCLHSRNVPSMNARRPERPESLQDQDECSQSCEISAVGEARSSSDIQKSNSDDNDDDPQDWWTVQVIESKPLGWLFSRTQSGSTGSRIKALETTFRLRHNVLGCYLHTTERELSEEDVLGGAGRKELSCVRDENMRPSTVWRITMNEHDYLPMDTALAVYPKMSTLQKIAELHTLMWTRPRAFEASDSWKRPDTQPSLWSLMMGTTSARTLWRRTHHDDPDLAETKDRSGVVRDNGDGDEVRENGGTIQQNSIVANPAVWWTSGLGLAVFAGLQVLFLLGGRFGYMENGSSLTIMKQQLSASTSLFAAWALHIIPLIFPLLPDTWSVDRSWLNLYYPALYCAILVSSTVLSSLLSALVSRRRQFSFLLVLILIITSTSNLISPLSYGTRMPLSHCQSLTHWVNKGAALLQFPMLVQQDQISRPTTVLDCGVSPSSTGPSFFTSPLQITPVVHRKRAPVLQKHYPSVDEALPMQHIFMTPSQRPPQLWYVNRQAGEPNPYQRQQMQAIFEKIEMEEKQRRVKEKLELEEKERLARLERQRLELEEKRREMERELKREQDAKERERLRLEEKRRWEMELEVEEELRREQEARRETIDW